jgi:NAD(P)-dependent dehydrogenase (short-subunit alcohol dehydrogenase family)
MDINDSVVLLTGANRGLGRALLDALLDRGVRHVYAAARNPRALPDLGYRATPVRLDLTSTVDIVEAATRCADVTLLVNNASGARFADPFTADRDGLAQEMATNYTGTVDVIRAFAPVIEAAGGGAVVNILSLLALASTPPMAGYSASKAAMHSYTQAIRPGLRARGITVHGIYPGGMDTDMLAGFDVPKADPRAVAEAILDGIADGLEDVFPDPVSQQMSAVWWADPKAYERSFAG